MYADQVLSADGSRYANARRYAKKINDRCDSADPNKWDPCTDVFAFVEDGLLLRGY
ncbi:hypothetical protein AB0903_27035 [Streptomyces sp. NPDC048389]|uniref:hypothetical protein n=1 Tax=Streptomyces sp. NPDC048389 TaxID=3154622 RepID=UPI0034569299